MIEKALVPSAVLAALVLPGIVPCFFSGQLSPQYFVEIWQQFLWTALTAIFCWDLAAIFLISSSSNILVRFGSNSLWAAVISLDGFDSNILVSFGSNSLWAALVAIYMVRFGSYFSGHIWQQYFGEIRHQFSLGSCGNNIWCDNNLPDVENIYLVWKPGISEACSVWNYGKSDGVLS